MLAAWQTFTQLHATLDETEYSHACDTLFTRWEAIAQDLKDKRYMTMDQEIYHVLTCTDLMRTMSLREL